MNYHAKGSALPVTLIMLLVVTMLGIAGLRMAQAELKMTGAFQSFASAFSAAESAIEDSLANRSFSATMPETIDPPISIGASISGQTTRNYLDTGDIPGGGYDKANNKYTAYHYETRSVGTAPGNASVTLVQGMYQVANSGN